MKDYPGDLSKLQVRCSDDYILHMYFICGADSSAKEVVALGAYKYSWVSS